MGRLLNSALGGQAGWLVPLALAALVVGLAVTGLRRRDPRTSWLVGVGGAFATIAFVFSTAQGIFHPYYVELVAPFTALLVGAAVGLVSSRRVPRAALVAALGFAAVAGEAAVLDQVGTSASHVVLFTALSAAALAGLAWATTRGGSWTTHWIAVAAVGVVLLATPASWAYATTGHVTSGTFPTGGSTSQSIGVGGGGGMFGGSSSSLTAAEAYAAANGGGNIAVASQSTAATAILAGHTEVVGIGGFSGSETEVDSAWLADEVGAGKVRWVLTSSTGMGGNSAGRVGATKVMAAVESSCVAVPGVSGLYDCSTSTTALAAASS